MLLWIVNFNMFFSTYILPYTQYTNAFESSSIIYFYLPINNIFTFIITSSMLYMFICLAFFIFLKANIIYNSSLLSNINFIAIHNFKKILLDIIYSYFTYKRNIFFLFFGYIFVFIFLNNIIGIIPFSNTINNHFNITGMLSFICWFGILLIGLKFYNTRLFTMFCVSGIPRILIFFLAYIEILSYFFRFISLSLRLFANIVAGHLLLETIYIFLYKNTISLNNNKIINTVFITVPSLFFILLIIFEMIISGLQAYIFVVLCLIYVKDSLYLH